MRKLITILLAVMWGGMVYSQCNAPIINTFSPNTGFIGSTVTISGAFFSATPSDNVVYFGATKATVQSSSFGSLTVTVPVGATTSLISVTNACNKTAFSQVPFNGIFCPTPLTTTTYQNTAFQLNGIYGAYNMLSQDMDLDGKPDVLSVTTNGMTVARNTSTPGSLTFTAFNSTPGGSSIFVADMDGDGLKDVILPQGVRRNTSTVGNIVLGGIITVPGGDVSSYQVAAGDFNNDGKPDMVGESGGSIYVAFNTSTGPGNIAFSTRVNVGNVTNRATGLQVADVDGDGKIDILGTQGDANRAFTLRNITAAGSSTPTFEAPEYWNSGGQYPYRCQIADFDKDGKIDLTTCNYNGATNTAIYRNTSTVGDISFAATVNLAAPVNNYRIQVGDVNGDGLPDILTKSLGVNVFSVYPNTSTGPGNITFGARVDYSSSTQAEVSGMAIGDLDGDYVPDIATSGISSNTIRFHRNVSSQNDVTPPTAICKNIIIGLSPTGTATVTASMIDNGSSDACGIGALLINGASSATYTCANIGANTATLTVTDLAGNSTTCTATVTVAPAAIIVSGQTTVCQGQTVPLNANQGDSYQWYMNGNLIGGATSQTYVAVATGNYTVAVTNNGGCSGVSDPTTVTINPVPNITITASGSTDICQGNTVTLTASNASAYLWSNGATSQSVIIGSAGNYSLTAYDASGCSATSSPVAVTVKSGALPTATITANGPLAFCEGGNVVLTANSNAGYLWSDGSNTQSITVTQSGTYSVITNNTDGCTATSSSVTTEALINPTVTASGSAATCVTPVQLNASGNSNGVAVANQNETYCLYDYQGGSGNCAFTNNLCTDGYNFASNGTYTTTVNSATTPSTLAFNFYFTCYQPTFTVYLNGVQVATYTETGNGCTCDAPSFGTYPRTLTVPTAAINANWISGNNTLSVTVSSTNQTALAGITATAGYPGESYSWSPAAGLSNASIANPTALPSATTTYTVTYTSSNGCTATDQATVTVNPGPTVSLGAFAQVSVGSGPLTLTGGSPAGGTYSGTGVTNGVFNPAAAGVGTFNINYSYTDGNGCSNVATSSITVVPCNITLSTTTTSVSCPGGSTGSVSLTVNNANQPSFAWTGPNGFTANTQNISNLAAGTYTVSVVDVEACTANSTASVTFVPETNAPTAVAQNFTVNLSSAGNASITASDINNGSSDDCSIASMTVSPSSFTCANVGANTVTLTVTDINGNVSTATAVVTVTGLDTDNDGVPNVCDLDDDNDGILDINECTNTSNFFWSNGPSLQNPVNGLATSATGTINGIGYTYSSNVNFTTTSNLFMVSKFPSSYNIPNQTSIRNDLASQNTLTFNQPMTNPILVFASIGGGQPSPTVSIQFFNDFDVLWAESNTTTYDLNLKKVTGTEGNIVIRFNGTYSSLSFNYLNAETYVNFAFGADFAQPCTQDDDNDGIINSLDTDRDGDGCSDAIEGSAGFGLNQTANGQLIGAVSSNGIPLIAGAGQTAGTSGNASANCFCELSIDSILPIVNTQNITVQLNAAGFASITASQVDNGSTDNCGITSLAVTPNSFICANVGANTVTLIASDANGNISSASATVTVEDNIAPSISCASNASTIATSAAGATVSFAAPTASDNCAGVTIAQTAGLPSGSTFPLGITTNTFEATDASGNTSSCSFTVEVIGVQPQIVCPSNITVGNDLGACGAIVTYVATDPTGIPPSSITYSINPGSYFSLGTTTVSATASNAVGTSTCSFDVTVNDTELPAVLTQNVTVQLDATGNGSTTAAQIDNGSSDNCGIASVVASQTSFTCANVGANTVTLTVTDVNGNVSTGTATVTVEDNIAPVISSQNITIQLDANGSASITAAQLDNGSADACGVASVVASQTNFDCANIGANTVTLTVTDVNGNVSTATTTVTVEDNIAPVSTSCPANIVVNNLPNNCFQVTSFTLPTFTDACGILSVVESNDNNVFIYPISASIYVGAFPVGITTVNYTATDNNGNSTVCSFTVTVNDVQTPYITNCPSNITVNAPANSCEQIATWTTPLVSDNCPNWTISSTSQSGSMFAVGTTTVTYNVADASGNASTCSFTVTVNDVTMPTAIAQDIVVQLDATGAASITAAQIDNGSNDACGIASTSVSPSSFTCANVGNNTVTLTVTDNNGNVSTATAIVAVEDNIAPVVATQNITVQLDAAGSASITGAQVDNGSADACGIASMSVAPSSFDCSNVGVNTVTLTVTDVNGNVSTGTATVTIEDNVAPAVATQNITVQLDASGAGSIVAADVDNGSADACGIASLSVAPSSFDCSNVGANTVTLTVTDVNGNVSSATATVTVEDNVAPSVATQNITVQLDAAGSGSITAAQVDNGSSDACGIASISVAPSSFDCSNVGANTVTLTVTDVNGNVSTGTATVTVEDNVAPVVATQNITVQLDANGSASITPAQVDNGSSDACGIASMSVAPSNFDCSNVGANTVTLTVTDVNGNVSTATATVTVEDNVAPVVATQNITVQLDAAGSASIAAGDVNNGSSDACGIASLSVAPSSFNCSNVGANTVTLTVTDVNGNVSSATATVTVEDNVAPVVATQNITVQLDAAGAASITAAQIDNGSSDACGIASLSVAPSNFDCSNVGANTVTLTVTDVNGNVSSAMATVTVQDNIAPVIVCGSNITVTAAPGDCAANVSWNEPTVTEACAYTVTSSAASGSSFAIGTTTVNYNVTDASGNDAACSFTVTVNPSPIQLTVSADAKASGSNISCNGGNDGSATATVSGGCAPYTYSWSNGSNAATASGLVAGTYSVTITDNNGTAVFATVTLTEPSALVAHSSANTSICYGASTTLSGSANGGSAPYSASWTPAAGLSAASSFTTVATPSQTTTYSINVTDLNGCVASSATSVTVFDLPVPTITATVQDWCNGIALNATSSTSDFAWAWSNGATTQGIYLTIADGAGVYTVTVTDQNGCVGTTTASYNFNPQTSFSSYTILAEEEVDLDKYNKVVTGSVGVMNQNGTAKIDKYVEINSAGSFLKADNIYASSQAIINQTISNAATGIALPTMIYHSYASYYSSVTIPANQTATVNSNNVNVTAKQGSTVTLTGNYYGNVKLEKNARVIFTQDTVYIKEMDIQKGINGITKVTFNQDAVVIVSDEISIKQNAVFNTGMKRVTVYIGKAVVKNNWNNSGCGSYTNGGNSTLNYYSGELKVIAYNTYFNANVYAKGGEIEVEGEGGGPNSYMNGVFIAEEVESHAHDVLWNNAYNSCNALASTSNKQGMDAFEYVFVPYVATANPTAENVTPEPAQAATESVELVVYPNPTADLFTIRFNAESSDVVNVKVYTMSGQVVYVGKVQPNVSVQMEEFLPAGVYMVEAIQNDNRRMMRVIKQ